jgi:hypothetical protein
LIGPWKEKRWPVAQEVRGTEMVTMTLVPGERSPLEGLKVTFPGMSVKAVQCRSLWLLALERTRAWQMYVLCFWQSRCPTRLMEAGWRSRMAGAAWGTSVGVGVGMRVGVGVGVNVGVGVEVGVGVVLALSGDCTVVAVPQEMSRKLMKTQ